jgi:gamma-butyrobetaine dioxygenase
MTAPDRVRSGIDIARRPDGVVDVLLRRPDGATVPVHPIWLRERCSASTSLDPLTLQRLFEPPDLPLSLSIVAADATGGDELRVKFSDGHDGVFSIVTLLAEATAQSGIYAPVKPHLWDRRLNPMPSSDWRRIGDGAAMTELLESFLTLGFAVLRNVPTTPGSVLDVARRFGHVRSTNFGDLFDVRAKAQADDLAYTGLALAPHTDNPYRDPVPGIQLLHCLVNEAEGGDSTLVDGFAVAAELRRRDPDGFAMLTRTPVRYRYCDGTTELIAWRVPIEIDGQGAFVAINHSPRLDFVPLLPRAELDIYYRARRTFTALLASDDFALRFRLGPGDLEMFDNRRVLHGRTAFDGKSGARHLQGCYIDRDGPDSLYRVLCRAGRAPAA